MVKYLCDKCGKELEVTDIFTVNVTPPDIRRWDDNARTGICIMCRDCLDAFQNWLKTEPKTRNLCGKPVCDHIFDDDCELKTDCAWR